MADETAGVSVDETENQTSGTEAPPVEAARSFTTDDVERIVRERLARDRKDRPSDDEIKTLRERAKKFDEIEESNQTELERAQQLAETLRKQFEDSERARQDALLNAAVVSEAAKKNVVDPESAIKLIDRSTLVFDDDGAPSNLSEVMDELLTAKPFLVAQPDNTRGSADQGARTAGGVKQVTESELKSMPWQEVEKARKEGRLKSLLSG